MVDWDGDDFMSQWDKKYVKTNVGPNSKSYEKEFFLRLSEGLSSSQPQLKDVAYALIATACCAVGRADVVGRFFDDITADATPDDSARIFLRVREAITIIFPYLGLPTCVPACYGMIGVIQRKGTQFASTKVLRQPIITQEDAQKGKELRAKIYHGVGNSEIFGLMNTYFTDLYTTSTVVSWGYLIAKTNEEVFQPYESHLIVCTAITALGATRQTKSHIKATLGIGNPINAVKAVLKTVTQIADWADRPPIGPFDVDELAVKPFQKHFPGETVKTRLGCDKTYEVCLDSPNGTSMNTFLGDTSRVGFKNARREDRTVHSCADIMNYGIEAEIQLQPWKVFPPTRDPN